jgi:hypothetical protein
MQAEGVEHQLLRNYYPHPGNGWPCLCQPYLSLYLHHRELNLDGYYSEPGISRADKFGQC